MTQSGGRPEGATPPDLRLFGPALGLWAATIASLGLAPPIAVGGAVAAAALAGVFAWRARSAASRPPRLPARPTAGGAARHTAAHARGGLAGRSARRAAVHWAVAAALLGITCGALATAARTSARDAQPLAGLAAARATVRVDLTVIDDPRPLASTRPGPATYLIPARIDRINTAAGPIALDERVLVFATDAGWRALLPTQGVSTDGRLAPPDGGDLTAALLTAVGAPRLAAPPSWLQRAAGRLRAGLQAACAPLPPEPGGLLPGLVLGDTSRLDPALAAEFKTTGLTHLTAVSGANLAIVLGVVLFTLRWCRAGPWLSASLCGLALAGFVILARPSPSVVRAAGMGAIGLLALASGRGRAAPPALATAVMVSLLVDPALAFDAGFTLSVLATGALVLLAPRWCAALRDRGVPAGLAAALAAPAAAQVACGPVIAALSGAVSIVAVPANLLAAFAVAPATLLGVAAATISALWPAGAADLAWLAAWPARWLVGVAHVGAGIPAGSLPWPSGAWGALLLALATVAIAVGLRWPGPRRFALVIALAVVAGVAPIRVAAPGWPPTGAVLIACDVGQGDALVLPVAAGEAIVVDAGPDPVLVDACLSRLGVTIVPVLILTHFHADHIGGLTGVLRHRRVTALVVSTFDEPAAGYEAVRREAAGVALTAIGPEWTYTVGSLRLQLLGPVQTLTGTRSDPNNNSLVLRVENRGVSILLAGDAETEEQHDLAGLPSALVHADVLKVAHHGSAYQDPDFLEAVDPAVAVVSVGADNPYGHPNEAMLARLARAGARVYRTDRDGDVAVVRTDRGLGVVVRTD